MQSGEERSLLRLRHPQLEFAKHLGLVRVYKEGYDTDDQENDRTARKRRRVLARHLGLTFFARIGFVLATQVDPKGSCSLQYLNQINGSNHDEPAPSAQH